MRMQTQFRGNKWGMHHFIQLAMRQKSKECAKNGKIIVKNSAKYLIFKFSCDDKETSSRVPQVADEDQSNCILCES